MKTIINFYKKLIRKYRFRSNCTTGTSKKITKKIRFKMVVSPPSIDIKEVNLAYTELIVGTWQHCCRIYYVVREHVGADLTQRLFDSIDIMFKMLLLSGKLRK